MKLGNDNNLTASDYLIYNPFIIDETVDVILNNENIILGTVTKLFYNFIEKTITTTIRLNIDNGKQLTNSNNNLIKYISVEYNLINKQFSFKNIFKNITSIVSPDEIEKVIPKSSDNRKFFQDLFECNYVCKLKDTDLCINCDNDALKDLNKCGEFLLGDRVKMKDTNYKATIIGISHYNEFMNTNNDICYSYLIDDRDVNLDKKIIDNHSLLPFRFRKDNTLNLYYRAGYVKNIINDYYCNKCIFQSCDKCLIKKL